jgi:diphosphomevalonate decarboxylase
MSNQQPIKGFTSWKSPSNIALVKYWGKFGNQMPKNASVSFTLDHAFTQTSIAYSSRPNASDEISIHFLFEGQENPSFQKKIQVFLISALHEFPFLKELHLDIKSENSFPHSTGIASSASSMSALALCLCQMKREITGELLNEDDFLRKASIIARLGSGSACRSVFPYLGLWGELTQVENSSNEYAIPVYQEVAPVFKTFRDSILIISATEKSVSSRAGHSLMEGNPYAEARYQQANQHVIEILDAMRLGDLEKWGNIVEKEALTLHALMMASEPPYILMHPNTLEVINKIRTFRQENNVPVYFTLDAGPNVHILYPHNVKDMVTHFIEEELVYLCENGRVIHDNVGKGPRKIS